MSFNKDIIKKSNEIKNVIYSGRKIESHYIDYFYKKNTISRVAVVIKRSLKKAHERNKIKRRIREIYRNYNKTKKVDIIIKVKKNIIQNNYKEIKKEILLQIEKIEGKREKSE